MNKVRVLVFASVLFLTLSGVVSAQGITTSVTQEGSNIMIEVNRGGEPLPNATVRLKGVNKETDLDGSYTTDGRGMVVFGETATRNLSGVIHLRIDVRSRNSSKSTVTTITRPPSIREKGDFGTRFSKVLSDSSSTTYGEVEGRIFVRRVESIGRGVNDGSQGNSDTIQIGLLLDQYRALSQELGNIRFNESVLGRRLATGGISTQRFYLSAIELSAKRRMIRSELKLILGKMRGYSDKNLETSGIDPFLVNQKYFSLKKGKQLNLQTGIRKF
ncbi:MAG: hypothetical protein ABEK59_09370 [Halobacteria archaeon]